MKLALGTVQFGTEYGAFNTRGQVTQDDVAAILKRAYAAGIDTLDTARGYGRSEEVLGKTLSDPFRIVTKCPPVNSAQEMLSAFETSQTLLERPIDGYLLHNTADLLGPQGDEIWDTLCLLRDQGRVNRIGVSSYGIDEVHEVLNRYPITLVQLPANVLNPWFGSADLPETLEVHTRSAFLQGFLLSDPETLTGRFAPWKETLRDFRARAAELELTPLKATLLPLLQSDAIHKVLIGVDSLAQFDEILSAVATDRSDTPYDMGSFPEVSSELTDPRTW